MGERAGDPLHNMAATGYPYFSRAGWVPFGGCVALAMAVGHFAGWWWSAPLWLACGAIVYLYRDPNREIPSSPLAVVSPADGVVRAVETVTLQPAVPGLRLVVQRRLFPGKLFI